MKKRCAITAICLALGPFTMNGPAFAHGTEEHGKHNPADAQMKKMHAMMPMFSEASAQLQAALEFSLKATETRGSGPARVPALRTAGPRTSRAFRGDLRVMANFSLCGGPV